MRVQRTKSVADKTNFAALSKLPDIMVPKFTVDHYDIFTIAFCSVTSNNIGMNAISIEYLMRGVTGNYYFPWMTPEDKLKNCLLRTGDSFNNNNITLYLLYSQYIVTEVTGSNIINKYHSTNNGCKCHQDFDLHFRNDDYMNNKATEATSTTNSAVYIGDCRNFTL